MKKSVLSAAVMSIILVACGSSEQEGAATQVDTITTISAVVDSPSVPTEDTTAIAVDSINQ